MVIIMIIIIIEIFFVFEYSCRSLYRYRQLTTGCLKLRDVLVYSINKYVNQLETEKTKTKEKNFHLVRWLLLLLLLLLIIIIIIIERKLLSNMNLFYHDKINITFSHTTGSHAKPNHAA